MTCIFANRLDNISGLKTRAEKAQIVDWRGRRAFHLDSGLLLIPDLCLENACVEVHIGADGPSYPGVVFRASDVLNFELVYAVPHVSGQWDALQYDPVFHGSNTWQIYHGKAYQGATQIPMDRWFCLRVIFHGNRASISVDGQSPLVVEGLAHDLHPGLVGLWTYKPAHFCDLRIEEYCTGDIPEGVTAERVPGSVEAWFLEGYGVVSCEPNGVLNLNRYLPVSQGAARLTRQFALSEATEVRFDFGFSDILTLEIDGNPAYQGENIFQGFKDRITRGYASPGLYTLKRVLERGEHLLTATLETREPFGWGFSLAAFGNGLSWLPEGWG
jgi:hypothetical protein